MGVASVLRVNESTFVSKVTRHESFRDHKLPFRPREVFSLTPSATLVKFDSKSDDRQIKFIIKRDFWSSWIIKSSFSAVAEFIILDLWLKLTLATVDVGL